MRSARILSVFVLLLVYTNISAQQRKWQSIMLLDTIREYGFAVDALENARYGPANLLDNNLKTCWVTGSSALYLLVPQYNRVLNIFNGYGKSAALYRQNSRAKKLRLSFYLGVQPEGHVSEIGAEYYLYDPEISQEVELSDSMEIKHIMLSDSIFDDQLILDDAFNSFAKKIGFAINEVAPLIKLTIIDTYGGSKYDDICISELYFSDKYMSYRPKTNTVTIDSLFINEEENKLMGRLTTGQTQVIYSNNDEVVWLAETSTDGNWAILMTMPVESDGRGLSQFLLVDTRSKSVVNTDLEQSLGRKISQMFFKYQGRKLYLNYFTLDDEEYNVQLE